MLMPQVPQVPQAPQVPGAAPLPFEGKVVLVAEDSQVQRRHAVDVVRGLGAAEVLEAADGLEGLALFTRHPRIDLVLTDLEMPNMDGVGFIGEFAARGYRPEVVIASTHDLAVLHSVRLMAVTYGLVVPGVIHKPMAAEALARLFPAGRRARPAAAVAQHPLPTQAEIRAGIAAGGFICYFQPQITFKGAVLKGAEALARWRHPDHGLLGPAAFLPQVEASEELMLDLTRAVLADVASHWHQWKRHGFSVDVSVNLSALSLGQAGFADLLIEACASLDLPPRNLVFEVTESASMSNLGESLANLVRLRMRGFRLSIDDFGTGFATFEQLERIPFTELKVDRSIIQFLPDDQRHVVLVQGMLQMARGLNLVTVAEGIETLETWNVLRGYGCDLAQGYLVARPMPGAQIRDWANLDRAHLRA
jgi:EAL domain-containing protein (putative c-di-GMP-specific phosphodiesterase class I)/FixJ family two-component response regulator